MRLSTGLRRFVSFYATCGVISIWRSSANRLGAAQRGATQLLDQANRALDLSQTCYKLGLGSIVELSQPQLQQTQAAIGNTQAGYEYRLSLAVLYYQTGGAIVTAIPRLLRLLRLRPGSKLTPFPVNPCPLYDDRFSTSLDAGFSLQIESDTLRVRIVFDYTYPDENMLGPDDSKGGSPQTFAQLPGLKYDAESHTIVYEADGKQSTCAQVEERTGIFGSTKSRTPALARLQPGIQTTLKTTDGKSAVGARLTHILKSAEGGQHAKSQNTG